MRIDYFIGLFLMLSIVSCEKTSVTSPEPYGPTPSNAQLNWQELEMIGIIHFGLNTFIDEEWGYGDADPKDFTPSDFDAEQMVLAAKDAGLKGFILVAKHHDGFCLWPTETTSYNITQSPWEDGEGDMVKSFQEACEKHDMQFGIYCSPWDRNNEHYGTDEYLTIYRDQLRELYTDYGELFESWHDGANGGDGYYGGARETRKIDRSTYYDWDNTWEITRKLQPNAVIFSDSGWDVRWVGNERGYAADTTWQTFTPKGLKGTKPAPGNVQTDESPIGTRNGEYWMPAEVDVPLRRGWFWREEENELVKSPERLIDIYINSVGRAGTLNLGLAPDTTGQFHESDVKSLKVFGEKLKKTFTDNFAKNASFKASNIRGKAENKYGPQFLIDGDRYTYWATDDDIHEPNLEIELDEDYNFDLIQVRENIKLGQRIESIAIDIWNNEEWEEVATATGIGANRLIELPNSVTTNKIRLRVTESPVSIALSGFGVFKLDN